MGRDGVRGYAVLSGGRLGFSGWFLLCLFSVGYSGLLSVEGWLATWLCTMKFQVI